MYVFENVFLAAARGKNRIPVTHALHFLPQVDYIYTMTEGIFDEHGTYADLMAAHGDFAHFVNEFGCKESESEKEDALRRRRSMTRRTGTRRTRRRWR